MSARRKPYTAKGIHRVPCFRCGAPSHHQWHICSDNNRPRGLCKLCDVLMNDLVLEFLGDAERPQKMAAYIQRMRA